MQMVYENILENPKDSKDCFIDTWLKEFSL